MVVPVPELLEFLDRFKEEKYPESRIVLSSIPGTFRSWAFADATPSTSVEDPEVLSDESENSTFKRLQILQYTFERRKGGRRLS